eukprot:COSAG05_NODE_685_length_7933_cov_622.457110_2_plen_85_part_00
MVPLRSAFRPPVALPQPRQMRKSPRGPASPGGADEESWRTGPAHLWEAPSAKSAVRAEIAKYARTTPLAVGPASQRRPAGSRRG